MLIPPPQPSSRGHGLTLEGQGSRRSPCHCRRVLGYMISSVTASDVKKVTVAKASRMVSDQNALVSECQHLATVGPNVPTQRDVNPSLSVF